MKKNMKNMVNFISSIILIALTLCLIGCPCSDDFVADLSPLQIYNVKFQPETVKIGDEITITYLINDPSHYFDYKKVTIDENGNLKDKNRLFGDPVATNKFVSFGTDVSCDIYTIKVENGKEYVEYRQKWADIYPEKYTFLGKNEVKCIVPKNAKSGHIHLELNGMHYYGYSLKELTVLDASGDIIK